MSAIAAAPIAVVEDDCLLLREFRESDPEVIAFVTEQDDLVASTHRCLQIGARALAGTQARVDTSEVQRAFEQLHHAFASQVSEGHDQLRQTLLAAIGGDDAYLQRCMAAFEARLGEHLHDTFDPASRDSVLGLVQTLLDQSLREQGQALGRLLNPSDPESPIRAIRTDLLDAVRHESEHLRDALNQISERVAVRDAQAQLQERCASKGVSYEALVHEALLEITADQGDLALATGTEAGAAGRKTGDEVIQLDPSISNGRDLRYVLEIKDRAMTTQAIHAELDLAISNRQAGVGIGVFSSMEGCPSRKPFQAFGNKALVVFDKDHLDESALRLATHWARWMLCRDQIADKDAIDLAAGKAALEDATRALTRIDTIRRFHGGVAKQLTHAGDAVNDLQRDMQAALDRLTEVLSCS
jgi:hypothetical protein